MSAGPLPLAADPRESQGIYVDADTVFCEDCRYAGLPIDPSDRRCRKCASQSVVALLGIVAGLSAKESNAVL